MDRLLKKLREFDALRDEPKGKGDSVERRTLPFEKPSFDNSVIARLHPLVRSALSAKGIDSLYEHQGRAIEHALAKRDVVLEAPTASGKTLAFSVPMFETLLRDPYSRALMVYPMKAVANDQRLQIDEMARTISKTGAEITSWTFDGDTDKAWRPILKKDPPSILLTNPEMVHYSFLGWSQQWERFLKDLRFIVIDEIHEYRGYFGTNFALLLRRFLLVLDRLGCHPQLFLASATCANPLEHAQRLTGREFTLVSAATKFRPKRHFAFISPHIPDFHFRDIYQLRIARAALACLAGGLSRGCPIGS